MLALPSTRRARITAVVVVLALAAGGFWWWRTHRTGLHLTGDFSAAVGLYAGSDVRILGVPVGTVSSVTPHPTYVSVEMDLDPGVPVKADTDAVIVAPNLVADRYVELTGAWNGGPKLRDDAVLGPSHTRTPVELDDLYRNLQQLTAALGPKGANRDGALSRLLDTGAANLEGLGSTLNSTIGRLSAAGGTLAASKDDIFATVDQLSTFTGTLKTHNSALVTVNQDLASVSQTLAADRNSFGTAITALESALVTVQKFIHDNRAALTSNVDKLSGVAALLGKHRDSLAKAVAAAPLLLQNFLKAYDASSGLLRGRADLNELTLWAKGVTSSSAADDVTTDATAATSGAASDAPPLLLPSAGGS